MTKSFKKILVISAAVLFIIAFLLDISDFGQYWNSVWRNVAIARVALTISLISALGLGLGLFFFRKKNYKQRISLTLPIAFILFSLTDISMLAIDYYGLNGEYNYFTAKRDIRNGKIQILEVGLILPDPELDWQKQAVQKIMEKRFGYKSVYLGCTITNGIIIYNNVMENYLAKVNGKDWRIKERRIRDSIITKLP